VCAAFREPGPMSPSQVVETLANGLADDPPICDLLANLHLRLEHEVDLDRVVEIRRTSPAAEISLADAIEQALPVLGLGRTKRPSRGLLIDRLLLVDRPPAAEAHRRLRRGAAGPS
jgi:Tetracyclin repressor-like, C-terminal domain